MERGWLCYAVLVVGQNVISGEEGRKVADAEQFEVRGVQKVVGISDRSVTRSRKGHRGERSGIDTRRGVCRCIKSTTTRLETAMAHHSAPSSELSILGQSIFAVFSSSPRWASSIRDRSASASVIIVRATALARKAVLTENSLARNHLDVANGFFL